MKTIKVISIITVKSLGGKKTIEKGNLKGLLGLSLHVFC